MTNLLPPASPLKCALAITNELAAVIAGTSNMNIHTEGTISPEPERVDIHESFPETSLTPSPSLLPEFIPSSPEDSLVEAIQIS